MRIKRASPVGGKKGCLCDNGKYNVECCTGDLKAQGIGSTTQQSVGNVNNVNEVRVTSSQN